jgi:hypothetical protein
MKTDMKRPVNFGLGAGLTKPPIRKYLLVFLPRSQMNLRSKYVSKFIPVQRLA